MRQRVRFTPITGHSNPDGQFATNSVRYTLNSGRLGEVFRMFAVDARFGDRKGPDPLGMAANIMLGAIPSSQTCYTCNISTPTVQVRSVHLLAGGMDHSAASISAPKAPAPQPECPSLIRFSHSAQLDVNGRNRP